jgi:hypothetical protein
MTGWVGRVVCIWEMRNEYEILVGLPKGKIRLGSVWRRWVDNIKTDL